MDVVNVPALLRNLAVALIMWALIAAITGWWWLGRIAAIVAIISVLALYVDGRLLARDLERAERLRGERGQS